MDSEGGVEPPHSRLICLAVEREREYDLAMGLSIDWPHSPSHHLSSRGAFMVTVGTFQKEHFFEGEEKLRALTGGLLKYAEKYQWRLQAWAVFPNHYHFVAFSPEDGGENLGRFIGHFHSRSAAWLNELEEVKGRKVWHNYWESHITHDTSYFARLNYVHQNAVRHELVNVAHDYPWCSAGWFERESSKPMVKTIYGFKTDRLEIEDDF